MSYGGELQANTQTIVAVGPFVAVADGFTPVTNVTLSGANEAELLKTNTGTVTDISGATWSAITNCRGWYALTLTTSHLNTEGNITVVVQDDDVCLPVRRSFNVLSQAAWASKYGPKDAGYMSVSEVRPSFGLVTAVTD
jgi:hypothetical protein